MQSWGRHGAVVFDRRTLGHTEPARFARPLIHQRKRWMLGEFANTAVALADASFWSNYPALASFKFFHRIVSVPAPQMLLISAATHFTGQSHAFAICLMALGTYSVDWLLLLLFGNRNGRSSVILFPLYLLLNPFFTLLIKLYTFGTLRGKAWGGPRSIDPETPNSNERTVQHLS